MTAFFSNLLGFAGTFTPEMILILFLMCSISEIIGLSVPYLLETTWLMAGYRFVSGSLPFVQLLALMLVALIGREAGMLVLYALSRRFSPLVTKLASRFKWTRNLNVDSAPKLFLKLNFYSSFSVAVGRILWLRIPLTLILGAQRKLKILVYGVALSTMVYDVTYTVIGAIVGTTTTLEPVQMLLIFLAALTATYVITFLTRRIIGLFKNRRKATSVIS
jgi:membrane-associated protein